MEKKERRGKEWRRKEGWWEKETRRRGNRGLPQLDKYFQFFGRSWNLVVSKVERDTTTHLPVKFVFERGRGRYRAVFELSRAASRYYRSIEFLKMKGCFVSRLIGKGRGGLFIGFGLCIRFGILTDFLARFLIFRLYLLPIFFKR